MKRLLYHTAVCCVAILPASATAQHLSAPIFAAANVARARALGLQLAPSLENVALPESSPTSDDIRRMAEETRQNLSQVLNKTQRKQSFLGLSLGVGEGVLKVGQYAGGGGAVLFGLQATNASTTPQSQNAGRNAAYTGAVAAGVTALADLLGLDAKKKARDACANLNSDEFGLRQQTYGWEGKASDPVFQAAFLQPNGPYQQFNDEVKKYVKDCLAGS